MKLIRLGDMRILGCMLLLLLCSIASGQGDSSLNHNYSNAPATRWQDALISGNGRMGILVHGDPRNERIIFNHEFLYEFLGTEEVEPADISDAIPTVKKMIKEGKYYEANQFALKRAFEKGHPDILWTDPYHPACVMEIHQEFEGEVTKYRRKTGYTDGEITVQWKSGDVEFNRKLFVSRPDNVIATRISASKPGFISVSIDLSHQLNTFDASKINKGKQRPDGIQVNLRKLHPKRLAELNTPLIEPFEKETKGNWQTFRVKYQIYDRGYEVIANVRNQGGSLNEKDGKLFVSGADSVEVIAEVIPIEPYSNSQVETSKQRITSLGSYAELLSEHAEVHGEMFGRVSLHLDKTGFKDAPNEILIKMQKASDTINPYLLEKVFKMGTYGLISSSGENPPNLMGIWNGEWRPKWSGDFTLDANVNLQIAAAAQANLPEAIDSYMTMLERVAPDWEVNAKNLFGCRGYLAGTRTSGRRNLHTHFGKWPGNHWTAGAGWLLSPCYEYYQCSGDQEFLTQRLMPMMEKTALFYEDFLDTDDENGNFLIVPSYSPENRPGNLKPAPGGVANAAMDISVIRELLTNLINSSEELEVNANKIEKWKNMLVKLPPYLVNQDGALKEWAHPDLADNYDHRHISHLYMAWPSLELTSENDKLFKAAQKAIEKRGRGNGSAHGLAHTALIGTRLKQPELVYGNLLFLLKGNYFYNSLFTSHNPGVIYNSDTLHSLPAIIMEMLIYSRPGVIEFLPACSTKLPNGTIKGVMCRTQAKVDSLTWDFSKKQIAATITSAKKQTINIQFRQQEFLTKIGPGEDSKSWSAPVDQLELRFNQGETKSIQIKW